MDWVNGLYGTEYIALRTAIWDKGFKGGHVGAEHKLSPEAIIWLDKAMDAYYENRVNNVLNQIEIATNEVIMKQWEELLFDMYGNEQSLKNAFIEKILSENNINQTAKDCLKKYYSNKK